MLDRYAIQQERERKQVIQDLLPWHKYSSTMPVCLMAPKLFFSTYRNKGIKQSKSCKQGKHKPASNWLISEPSIFLPAIVQQSRFHHFQCRLLLCFLKTCHFCYCQNNGSVTPSGWLSSEPINSRMKLYLIRHAECGHNVGQAAYASSVDLARMAADSPGISSASAEAMRMATI